MNHIVGRNPAQQRKLQNSPQISMGVGVAAGLFVGALFLTLQSPQRTFYWLEQTLQLFEKHSIAFYFLIGSCSWNCMLMGKFIRGIFGLQKQGAKLAVLIHRKKQNSFWTDFLTFIFLVLLFFAIFSFSTAFEIPVFRIYWRGLVFYLGSSVNRLSSALSAAGIGLYLIRALPKFKFKMPMLSRVELPAVPLLCDGIILGAVHEVESAEGHKDGRSPPCEWVMVGLKSLTGNLLITGVIGSGKSQILLQFLSQMLKNFRQRPALLAIDPKRTFVRELRRIIEEQEQHADLLWISLGGQVRFNPLWREGMLKNSVFISIANTLKLASINFLGSSGESRFWEQASFNLLKNSIVFCAAKYEYFTFTELYRTLIEARETSLAAELVDHLTTKSWSGEERANIEMAIDYFKNEFSQMDQKIRTSILATATGFLNEFLEYRVSQILSPKRDEITLHSISEAIDQGKLILLHIENDSLARSIGTLLKLMFEEAVLERVSRSQSDTARYAILVMDEYQDVATSGGGAGLGDDRYLAKARESKAITIAATQSVSSLENALRSEAATRELLQNFRSRIFGNSTDPRTIRLFQEPRGTEERERVSKSYSENSQNPSRDFMFGGFESGHASLTESLSTHTSLENVVTAKEFSRLRTFEAYAQIFDGLETRFEKLFLKPFYLKDIRTPHRKIIEGLKEASKVSTVVSLGWLSLLLSWGLLQTFLVPSAHAFPFPSICSVVKTNEFRSCVNYSVSACICGFPIPRPCAKLTYSVPQTFIEVWPNPRDSFFALWPGAQIQLAAHAVGAVIPFGADDENSSYAFHARAIPVPLAFPLLAPLPCGGTRIDKPCFDLNSQDLGANWNTGAADRLQPGYLIGGIAPQVCLAGGAAAGLAGIEPIAPLGIDSGACSFPLGWMPLYPPSTQQPCNGWGSVFPRTGIYEGASRGIAALMIASRLKSLGAEVSHTVPSGPGETWQMLYPQSSSCFKEGKNPGLLEMTQGLREESRWAGKHNGYLFVVWKKVDCCQDIPLAITSFAHLLALPLICAPIPGGGI